MRDTLRAKFFDQFVETALARTAASSTAVRENDADTARHELHSLAGECSMLGFDEISTFARDAEADAKTWVAGDQSKRVKCGRTVRLLQRAIDQLIASHAKPAEPEPEPEAAASAGEWRALIVDDSEIVADQLQELLEERKIACRIATTMEVTVKEANEFKPGIALVDLNMPGLDTAELVANLKAASPATKIVLVSGISDEELEQHSKTLQADGYVSKQEGIAAVIDCVVGHLPGLSK